MKLNLSRYSSVLFNLKIKNFNLIYLNNNNVFLLIYFSCFNTLFFNKTLKLSRILSFYKFTWKKSLSITPQNHKKLSNNGFLTTKFFAKNNLELCNYFIASKNNGIFANKHNFNNVTKLIKIKKIPFLVIYRFISKKFNNYFFYKNFQFYLFFVTFTNFSNTFYKFSVFQKVNPLVAIQYNLRKIPAKDILKLNFLLL